MICLTENNGKMNLLRTRGCISASVCFIFAMIFFVPLGLDGFGSTIFPSELRIEQWNMDPLKIYVLLNIGIFHGHVSVFVGIYSGRGLCRRGDVSTKYLCHTNWRT